MARTTLCLNVEYDEKLTDAEALAVAMDVLLETAMSTPGALEEYGPVSVGEFMLADCLRRTSA